MMKPPDIDAFLAAQREEIDGWYRQFEAEIDRAIFSGGAPAEPVKLTPRQKLRYRAWRVRGALAAPLVWVLSWLYPSALAMDE